MISLFELFSIGIGPSSSHTVGPMKAANAFVTLLKDQHQLNLCTKITVELFGSLALTGIGHATDKAVLLGLEGFSPATINPDQIPDLLARISLQKQLNLLQEYKIHFDRSTDLIFRSHETLPYHANALRFTAHREQGEILYSATYFSVGGGFILHEDEINLAHIITDITETVPYPFHSAKKLLDQCIAHGLTIAELMLANECHLRSENEVKTKILEIADTMLACIDRGCQVKGILPGGLNIPRRAHNLLLKLQQKGLPSSHEQTSSLEWLNLFAIAVNEENAAGGRVVTAPTNGAAGIIPAIWAYYLRFYPHAKREDAIEFFLTAGAIAILYKKGASISGAEVGCQGEVGVACSMAAGALTALLKGDLHQIENAAEIAMEHHLGLTCDPIMGLVQIPCIERNAMGAMKAVNASKLALLGDGSHYVSLDKVIATMKQTGMDMMSIYKETSLGGLAVNLPEC
ncbi:MAG: L-serine ammonia-lyase [Gammaproteobacteria bacterium]|nr:L-serine ammonia-lyase [Gammaproteobacteria bacterium]